MESSEEKDIKDRLLILESKVEGGMRDIASLRSSRHEHGNWLNRHNLEIKELELKFLHAETTINNINNNLNKIDTDVNALQNSFLSKVNEIKIEFITQMGMLKSDQRQTSWVVALIAGLIVILGKAALDYFMK